jgi:hypothetical protein
MELRSDRTGYMGEWKRNYGKIVTWYSRKLTRLRPAAPDLILGGILRSVMEG